MHGSAHALLHVGLSRTAWLLREKLMMTVSITLFAIVFFFFERTLCHCHSMG
jgi:hypothetical protein